MEISIGSYKVRLEILILMLILLWVIFGHALCSCTTMSAKEGFAAIASAVGGKETMKNKNTSKGSKGSTGSKGSKGGKEGFTSNNSSSSVFDSQFAQNNSNFSYMNPKNWAQQTLVYTPSIKPSAGVETIWARSKTNTPPGVPPLNFYDGMSFSPSCCGNSDTSNSSGCACYSVADYNYLKTRAGNNVPFSDM